MPFASAHVRVMQARRHSSRIAEIGLCGAFFLLSRMGLLLQAVPVGLTVELVIVVSTHRISCARFVHYMRLGWLLRRDRVSYFE